MGKTTLALELYNPKARTAVNRKEEDQAPPSGSELDPWADTHTSELTADDDVGVRNLRSDLETDVLTVAAEDW